jgi:hypothetical protein
VAFAFVVGEPEAVYAVSLAGAGIAFRGSAVEYAFKLCFVVFSACGVAHGGNIAIRRRAGNELIQNLSKTENLDKNFGRNQAGLFTLFAGNREVWYAVCVCKNQAGAVRLSPIPNFFPETENFSHPYFHGLNRKVWISKAGKPARQSAQAL